MENKEEPVHQEREKLEAWYPEHFYLDSSLNGWTISAATARQVEAALDEWPPPRWISFVDVAGARVRVRTLDIRYLQQCTPESRRLWKRFCREHKDGGDWMD